MPRARAHARGNRLAAHRQLYGALAAAHAVAGRRAESRRRASPWRSGPQAGLELVDALRTEPSLANYHLLPSVRGDLLSKLGRFDEARAELERAASLTRNARERDLLLERARACASSVERG